MDRISEKVFSHLSIAQGNGMRTYVKEVSEDPGYPVKHYTDLVHHVAKVGYENPRYNLFFRGQSKDWKVEVKEKKGRISKRSSIVPRIFRGGKLTMATKANMDESLRKLECASERLIHIRTAIDERDQRLNLYPEIRWALLQHYDIVDTPLIDVTQSLRVAASFATKNGSGFVYVFGLPPLQGSISYFVDEHMLAVRLLSACPPNAERAHFQEGYLVGHFPTDEHNHKKVHIGKTLNLSNRMVAKFFVPDQRKFWTAGFEAIPEEQLFPPDDPILCHLEPIKQYLEKDFLELSKRPSTKGQG